jgi:hypothetical protein
MPMIFSQFAGLLEPFPDSIAPLRKNSVAPTLAMPVTCRVDFDLFI